MKTTLYALAATLLVAPPASAQQKRLEFRIGDALHGPIKTARLERTLVAVRDGEEVEGERQLLAVINYTPDGKRSETESYSPDGGLRERRVQVYDDGGNLVEDERRDAADRVLDKKVYVRRGDEMLTLDGDGKLLRRDIAIWNASRDALVETRAYDGNGVLLRRSVNTRDPATGKSVWTDYNGDGSLSARNEFSPFVGTKNDRETRFRPDGTAAARRDVKLDRTADGMRMEATETGPDGKVLRKTLETREDDALGNLIKLTHYAWDEAADKFVRVGVSYTVITYY